MANKRIVKKQIRNLCGAIADELLYASCFIESFDDEKTDKLVARAAALQINALSHCSFAFDKSSKEFDSVHDYNEARRKYNRTAFAKLNADVKAEVAAILKEMNAMLPQELRDAVKAAATE